LIVYAISDLHLPARQKPMDVFGAHWENHFERIKSDWTARVEDDDIVLLPGDLSWAMRLEEALEDLKRVEELPGRKVFLRGNHDYWWSSIGKLRRSLGPNSYALQNDAMMIDGVLLAGSRGWTIPAEGASEEDKRIYNRERQRLEMSLKAARRLDAQKPIIVMMHYPPKQESLGPGFEDLMLEYGVSDCVYGHLHGQALMGAMCGMRNGIYYHQVSCDGLGFKLYTVKKF